MRIPIPLAAGTALVAAAAWLLMPPWLVLGEDDAAAPTAQAQVPAVEIASDDTNNLAAHPLARLAQRAPSSAWRRALALDESPERELLLRAIAGLWMTQDPISAMTAFEAADDDLLSTRWIAEKLGIWMTKDERASAQWAWSLTPGRCADLFAAALDHLLNYGKPESAVVALGERLLQRWAANDPAAAWEAASGDRRKEHWAHVVAQVWAKEDPRAALGAATRMYLWHRSAWVLDLLAEWAEADSRAAMKWALREAPSEDRKSLLAVAHATLTVSFPDEAAALELEPMVLSDPAHWEQLRKLFGDDPRALAEWMARQPDDYLRVSKAGGIAKLYGEADLFEAARWASELPPKESAQALSVLVPLIAEEDFGFAETIVLDANSAEAQTAAAGELLKDWPDDLGGPAAAYQWADENLPPAVRREASAVVFGPWGRQDPATAAAVWENVADPDERLVKGFMAVFGMWMGRDQDAPGRPTRYRDNPKAHRVRPPPDDVSVDAVAADCRYVGSPYHAHGSPSPRRPTATVCPAHLSRDHRRVEEWLRASVRAGRTGAWERGFPKYVWHREGDTVYEARQGAPGSGQYHGYPLQPAQRVRGL